MSAEGADPRLELAAEDLSVSGPVVARPAAGLNPILIAAVFALAAVVLFLVLNGRRLDRQEASLTTPASSAAGPAATAPPLQTPPGFAQGQGPMFPIPAPQFEESNMAAPMTPAQMAAMAPGMPASAVQPIDPTQRQRSPTLVVDLAEVGPVAGPANPSLTPTPVAGAAPSQRPSLSDEEQFAARVGDEDPERARATTMRNLATLVPQGTMLPGVLETAINSDLPGFTRAVVSRDVMGFDGRQVVIPRGSRLIGQYKSGVALGQSRAFVIWTRIIRPDGVSVQIGSPGTDTLGRGGLSGDVDRHFFRRFGGSILLSVLNAGVAAVSDTPSAQIIIGSPAEAVGVASQALAGETRVAPTIKVGQGEAIRIFVARDLDFSGVGPAR